MLAGPVVWAFDLLASYAVVKWTCLTSQHWMLDVLAIASLALIAAGSALSWNGLRVSRDHTATFMATLGLATSALFALQILAAWFPRWVLDACR